MSCPIQLYRNIPTSKSMNQQHISIHPLATNSGFIPTPMPKVELTVSAKLLMNHTLNMYLVKNLVVEDLDLLYQHMKDQQVLKEQLNLLYVKKCLPMLGYVIQRWDQFQWKFIH
jgi:hypothetical protein